MNIADSIINEKLKNVYFIWGSGKTTIANRLKEKYGYYVYSTDDAKDRLWETATPDEFPDMCRDYVKEYGVKSFWELPKEVIADREAHIQKEVTPVMIVELIALAKEHKVVICEGDLDYESVIPVAEHGVYLRNCGTKFDWFNRPDHSTLDGIKNRTDIGEAEKRAIIENAYAAVSGQEKILPAWVKEHHIKHIDWDDSIDAEQTLVDVEQYFLF